MKQMRINLLPIILMILLGLQGVVAQVEEPTITPTTPEAGTMARYGDLNITSASGQMSYSVPIAGITVDGNSWPVSLG